VHERLNDLFARQLKIPLQFSKGATQSLYRASTDRFVYQIQEGGNTAEGNIPFSVSVIPRDPKDKAQAELNQKNIARYIQKGVFESSLFQA